MTRKLLETAIALGYINEDQATEVCKETMRSSAPIGEVMINLKMISDNDLIDILMQTISVPEEKIVYKANKKKEPKITKKQIQKNKKSDKEIYNELIQRACSFMNARANGNEEKERHLFIIKTILDDRANPSDKWSINCYGDEDLQKRADEQWALFKKFSAEQLSNFVIEKIHAICSDVELEG